jgi:hypothetical protein
MLIGQNAPTLVGPLLGMQFSLVIISSPAPPSAITQSLAPAQKHNAGLFPMLLQSLVGFASYLWRCTLLCLAAHLSITTISVPSIYIQLYSA